MTNLPVPHGITINGIIAVVALIAGTVLITTGHGDPGQLLLGIGVGNGGGQAISTATAAARATLEPSEPPHTAP